jgi:hypothetical protein
VTSSNGRIDRPRDIAFERAFTTAAAVAAGMNPARITELAEQRVLPGELRDFLLRDWGQEGLDEGADWRNYLCWHTQLLDLSNRTDPPAREARAALYTALGHVVAAFEAHARARRLLLSHDARQEA